MKSTTPAALLALVVALPAAGQNLPGYEGDYDAAHAQFRAYALGEFQEVLAGWTEAVNRGDVDAAARFYAENASANLGQPATGAEAVRASLAAWIGGLDDIRLGLSDFDASGSMSYGAVHIVVDAVDPDDDGDGTLVFVLKKRGRDWEIRSQTLVMNR